MVDSLNPSVATMAAALAGGAALGATAGAASPPPRGPTPVL
jgi:hypothetical protein